MSHGLGEFDIIQRILDRFKPFPDTLTEPPGDDCAVIATDSGSDLLVTTDLLVEHIHFDLTTITPYQLGWKSMAVNVSDIAAMGGTPAFAFLSIGLNQAYSIELIDGITEGLNACAKTFGVALAGGDTTSSPGPLIINLCIIGFSKTKKIVKRSGAKPGDVVQISGPLGGSAAGLYILSNQLSQNNDTQPLTNAHLMPQPRVNTGLALAAISGVTAMIDISDGLIQDLGHICEQSGTGAVIDVNSIPLFSMAKKVFSDNPSMLLDFALSGGEDYELCWTVSPESADAALSAARRAGAPQPITIGRITTGSNVRVFDGDIEQFPTRGGFDHFKS